MSPLQFELVCEREYLRASFTSIMMFGSLVSSLIGGYLADRCVNTYFMSENADKGLKKKKI